MASLLTHVPKAKITSAVQAERAAAKRAGREPRAVKDNWIITIPGVLKGYRGYGRDLAITITVERRERAKGAPLKLQSSSVPAGRFYWVYERKVYVTTDSLLKPDDVVALVNEAANKRRLRLEKAHALQAMSRELDTKGRREPIPQDVKVTVWQRDGGRCVECGSNENLEFDHIIPLALGGSNTMRNLQLLCADCNNRKGATLG